MPEHRVRQGDCISSIAQKHGLLWEKVWNHPNNAQLKERRKDPNVLYPGDVVFVPEKEEKQESAATGQRHRFRKKGSTDTLRVRVLDEDDSARANVNYVLEIDGDLRNGTTDGEGAIEESIPAGAKGGSLTIEGDDPIPLSFGDLDPIETISGVQQRLLNLGFDCGDVTGEMNSETQEALRAFQQKSDLTESGEADQATKDKLVEVHGS